MKLLFKADPGKQASEIVKEQLRSPGSFNNVSSEVLWKGKSNKGEPAYVVSVLYDAQNGFGAMLRGCMFVSYHETADGKLGWNRDFGAREAPEALCNSATPANLKADYAKTLAKANSFVAEGAPIAAPAASAAAKPAVAPSAASSQSATATPTPVAAQTTSDKNPNEHEEVIVVRDIHQNRDASQSFSVLVERIEHNEKLVNFTLPSNTDSATVDVIFDNKGKRIRVKYVSHSKCDYCIVRAELAK